MQLLSALIIFTCASLYTLLLSHIADSFFILQKALVFPTIIFSLYIYFSWKTLFQSKSRWLLLFFCTLFIQILIVSTGGIKSPLLILLHLSMIGISFLFSFSFSLFFLLFSLLIIAIDPLSQMNIITLFQTEPTTLVLQIASFISIVPVAFIISEHYHFKDTLLKNLHEQTLANDAILQSLNEVVIVTDPHFTILSANDAATKILHKSKSELQGSQIFDVLLLKNKNNQLITKDMVSFGKAHSPITDEYQLMKMGFPQQIIMQAQPIKDSEGKNAQISFIITTKATTQTTSVNLSKARALYEAIIKNLKQDMQKKDSKTHNQLVKLEKLENDIYTAKSLSSETFTKNQAFINLAELCKQIVITNQDFAKIFHVPTDFGLRNFTQKDIAHLVSTKVKILPEQLTGPFFTAPCDAQYFETVIEKLIDISVLIASKESKPKVIATIEREGAKKITIDISGKCPSIPKDHLSDIFLPYYGRLTTVGNLHSGSGLEGYIAKTICDGLKLPLQVKMEKKTLSFIIHVDKSS